MSAKLLPELRSIGNQMGIKGAQRMRKADLVAAITDGGFQPAQAGASRSAQAPGRSGGSRRSQDSQRSGTEAAAEPVQSSPEQGSTEQSNPEPARRQHDSTEQSNPEQGGPETDRDNPQQGRRQRGRDQQRNRRDRNQQNSRQHDQQHGGGQQEAPELSTSQVSDEVGARLEALSHQAGSQQSGHHRTVEHENNEESPVSASGEEDYNGGRRSRRRRQRDRQNRRKRGGDQGGNNEPEASVREDDVLVACSGILDIRDQYAFVRTSGYLPGPGDAYVSMNLVRKQGLRKGDVITGAMRAKREGDRREKFAPLVRLDTVNGADPEQMRNRADFSRLTPLYPQERLRLETDAKNLTGRIIDLVSPIGKGQRGLIVSPPKAGKTMTMQSIANSITTNNPEVHLMVVLVDERPEEVTDFQRTVSGEVIASTFDRPADDHTQLAELAIERAKRLVELGHDVVVLLDGITRLGRAYNLAAPASGRILSGGVDSAALYPPKRFFGAARNIENGGSLTILATALVETGSKMDEVIFEEFKGTGNSELRLRREFANKRLFPAIDVDSSGTRREELLLSREETAIMWKLRRVLSGLDGSQALEMLLSKLRKTQTNTEFLFTIAKTTPGSD
nr:transcription termination factor Rho [Acidipropionibacterium jensenii]